MGTATESKGTSPNSVISNSVTLTVQDGYALPTWYSSASPSEIGRALTIGSAILDGNLPSPFQTEVASAVAAVREESVRAREKQLAAHHAHTEKLLDQHRSMLEAQRRLMQEEIDRLNVKAGNGQERIRELVGECDEMQVKLSEMEENGCVLASDCNYDTVRSHFEELAKHTCDVMAALASHHSLIEKVNQSAIQLRASIFIFYRRAKQVNAETPWLNAVMQLPFEEAFEHGIRRPWNNITATKAKMLEDGLGKEAFAVCKQTLGK